MSEIDRLLAIMARLRAPDGCPWDREQTFASIAPYTIEEAYEVADAIERGDPAEIKDELGDLLFQVVFHAEIGREAGRFDFDGVAGAICDKLVRRHPHVFAEPLALTPAEQTLRWEDIKARERQAKGRGSAPGASAPGRSALGESRPGGHLEGIPRALPALMRAYKISKRAARVGFDFEHPSQTADKVQEELDEVRAEAAEERLDARRIFEEIGDLLFAAANLARKLDVDAEAALRAANDKFERRFRAMEALAAGRGDTFADLGLEAQERLWQEVKRGE
jgi:MazG family protein